MEPGFWGCQDWPATERLRQRWATPTLQATQVTSVGALLTMKPVLNSTDKSKMPQRKHVPIKRSPLLIIISPTPRSFLGLCSGPSDCQSNFQLGSASSSPIASLHFHFLSADGGERLFPRSFRCCMNEAYSSCVSNPSCQSPLLLLESDTQTSPLGSCHHHTS